MRSDQTKKGIDRVPHRALIHATGVTKKNMDKPFIGIASSFSDLVPGHISMREFERAIEKGIHSGGGQAFIFGLPAICDGIAMGHSGMHYSLPSRELIADSVESMAQSHQLDGLILLTACDKITPGMLMAAARLDIPCIVVTVGPMLAGNRKTRRLSYVRDTWEKILVKAGEKVDEKELACLELEACPGCGSCQGLYTANSMGCLTEVLGMSLYGSGTALAVSAKKKRIAHESGEKIVELVKQGVTARKIMTKNAFINAIRVDNAIGGSTNTVLHLTAIAHEAGVEIPLKLFDEISKETPHIINLRPGGETFMEDFEYAGGIPAILNRLKDKLLSAEAVTGKNIKELAKAGEVYDNEVIRPLNNPYHKEGGLAVLYGNIAPDGCVIKQSAVSAKMMKFKGSAICFNSEEETNKAIRDKKIKPGMCIVTRYEGPKGGPGMREMLSPTSAIAAMGLADSVALITDGRFSGGTKGPCIGHISPEAAAKGVIAAIENGDQIEIDIPNRKINLLVGDPEIKMRLNKLKMPQPKVTSGWLARYAKLVTSANSGAVLKG